LIQEESKWMKVVADVEAHAHQRVNKTFASVLESEAKTQCLINATEITCKRKIFKTSCQAKKMIDKMKPDQVIIQNECDIQSMAVKEASAKALLQMKAIHVDELATSKMNHKTVIEDQQLQLQISKIKYKSTI
jgi:hypothetical protein